MLLYFLLLNSKKKHLYSCLAHIKNPFQMLSVSAADMLEKTKEKLFKRGTQ